MVTIPDVVFLIIGLACLFTLVSIRNELRKITRKQKRKPTEWSFEEMEKHRIKYLYHCRHLSKEA